MCRVLNKRKSGIPAGAIYIGRGSKWGNPFRIGPDGDRATVIARHERWLRDQHHLLRALDELRGHDVVCLCAARMPSRSLAWLANASGEHRIAWWRGQIDHRAWWCGVARAEISAGLTPSASRALRARVWPGWV